MDGDIAPVPELLALCERFGAWLLLDDAHGFGVLGRNGSGDAVALRRALAKPDLTWGRSARPRACSAPSSRGSEALIDTLVQRARPYIYTTALPPLLARALLASLEIIESEDRGGASGLLP